MSFSFPRTPSLSLALNYVHSWPARANRTKNPVEEYYRPALFLAWLSMNKRRHPCVSRSHTSRNNNVKAESDGQDSSCERQKNKTPLSFIFFSPSTATVQEKKKKKKNGSSEKASWRNSFLSAFFVLFVFVLFCFFPVNNNQNNNKLNKLKTKQSYNRLLLANVAPFHKLRVPYVSCSNLSLLSS